LTARNRYPTMTAVLRFLTAGESHGPALTVVVEGLPAGVPVERERIDSDLRRRQGGYGRGGRMQIEKDSVEVLSGVRHGRTLGSPVALLIRNKDHENWKDVMSPEPQPDAARERRRLRYPRPGHADLAGALKYGTSDLRNVLERASARETTARVAAGALARSLLCEAGAEIRSHVLRIGGAAVAEPVQPWDALAAVEESPVRCVEPGAAAAMIAEIDRAKKEGDTLGGVVEVVARGVVAGLGAFAHWDRRLDGRIAQALMSIPAVKAVSIGAGFDGAVARGASFHDEILWEPQAGLARPTNRAGGLEGGISNGEEIRASAVVKPIPTLLLPLRSVDLRTKEPQKASVERSDTCVVPAAGVVAEAMLALVLARALLEKTGGDSLEEVLAHLQATRDAQRPLAGPR
jgi:chorismate synthase